MTLTEAFQAVLKGTTAGHHPIHWVPSFNDLNSHASEDLDERERQESAAALHPVGLPDAVVAISMPVQTSNKRDIRSPAVDAPDFHKLVTSHNYGRKDFLYDAQREDHRDRRMSIWEYIIQSKTEGPHIRRFESLDTGNKGYVVAEDIDRALKVGPERAVQMVLEADTNADGRLSRDEYNEVLLRCGSP